MTTLDLTPSCAEMFEASTESCPRPGAVHRLGAYTAIRLVTRGPAPVIVFVAGEIDLSCADRLANCLRMALEAYPQGVELDLTSVRFCDCSGLRAVLCAQSFAKRRGRHFALGRRSPIVTRLIELTGAQSMLTDPR